MLWICVGLVVLVLVVLAAVCVVCRMAYYSSPKRRESPYDIPRGKQYAERKDQMLTLIRDLDSWPYEPVWITSDDGLKLFGRYYHVADGAPIELQMHGYRSTAVRDFCGTAAARRSGGRNVLLVDQRASGRSDGRIITFGVKERYDCLRWAQYMVERFGPETRIMLCGLSMGAATVLMAGALPLPPQVKCILADCSYSAPLEIITEVGKKSHVPPCICGALARTAARLGGFCLTQASPVEAVKQCRLPVLLIHGEADRFVPCEMSRRIHVACSSPCRLELFPAAGHGLSFLVDQPRYIQLVDAFTAQYLD